MPSAAEPGAEMWAAALDAAPERRFSPSEYWRRLAPHLRLFGISRVADITGLDHVGLPVAQAIRPMARSNAVTQGKAMTASGAAVGAVLECLEMRAGEDLGDWPDAAPGDPALWRDLACGADWPDAEMRWIAAWDLREGRSASVPRDVVSTDFARGADAEAAPILRTSIGLGAGADVSAALFHGLLEAIEGDARLRAEAGRTALVRVTAPPSDPVALAEAAGLRVALWQMPCAAAGIVAVKASIMEEPGASALPLPASGYAARPGAAAAVDAAVTEALQARLAVISGAREDLTQAVYAHGVPPEVLENEWARHGGVEAPGLSEPGRADWTVGRLVEALGGPVFAVMLHHAPEIPLCITRVLAPGLLADPLRLEGA